MADDEMSDDNYHRRRDTPLSKCPMPRWCEPQPPRPRYLLDDFPVRSNIQPTMGKPRKRKK